MNWKSISDHVLNDKKATKAEALALLESTDDELLDVLQSAYRIRHRYFSNTVSLHFLRNVKSGKCPEDCAFCSQSTSAINDVRRYDMQSVENIVSGARAAVKRNAKRYCLVSSTRAPAPKELETICTAAIQIKRQYPSLEICASLGLLTEKKAALLKASGVDRFNHNLETSERYFPEVVTTHEFEDRVHTARIVKNSGLDLCCGGLFGLGETPKDRIELIFTLADLNVDSVPINFLDPRPGTRFYGSSHSLKPNDALRILAMVRFVIPKTEIRIAGGREIVLRGLQSLALYPANSMFTSGYLTTGGQDYEADRRMIEDAGFKIQITESAAAAVSV